MMHFLRDTLSKVRPLLSVFSTPHHRPRVHCPKRLLRFELFEDRRMLAILSVGSGDGAVQVDVDGYGSFGRDQGGSAIGDANIDRIGSAGSTGLVWESGMIIRNSIS